VNVTYRLADHEGVLCVVATTPDYNQPRLLAHYWPTIARTLDFVRYHFDYDQWSDNAGWPALLAMFLVKESRPGEYWVEDTRYHGHCGSYLELLDGGRTKPVRTDTTPAPKPRCRLAVEWDAGRWWKNSVKGWVPA